jgi:hypothetical protein
MACQNRAARHGDPSCLRVRRAGYCWVPAVVGKKLVVSTNHGRRNSSILGASLISATRVAVSSPKYLMKIASAKPNANVDRSLAINRRSDRNRRRDDLRGRSEFANAGERRGERLRGFKLPCH